MKIASFARTLDTYSPTAHKRSLTRTRPLTLTLHTLAPTHSPTHSRQMIELKLKSLQIDNQMSLVQFPVMLCPTPTKIGDKPFLHLSVNIDNRNTTIDFYHYVGFMMQELDLKVEESLLMALLDFVWSMPQPPPADKPDAADGDGEGGENDGDEDGEAGAAAVTATPDSALSRQLYGDLIMLNPIQVNVSFATSPTTIEEVESGSSSSNPIAYIVRTLGVTLANIDNAPLKLNALVLENVFATQDELVGKIVHHYTMQGIRESYKVGFACWHPHKCLMGDCA